MSLTVFIRDCRTSPSQIQSFMNIYGQREQVPGAIIIDGVYLSIYYRT